MRKSLRILSLLCFLAVVAGCSSAQKTYYSGELVEKSGEIIFIDWANHMEMDLSDDSEEMVRTFVEPSGNGDSSEYSLWVEFYGEMEQTLGKDSPDQRNTMHIESMISHDGSNRLTYEVPLVGVYESEMDGKKQQLILYSDYTYVWTIFPNKTYEIVTRGEWKRMAPVHVLLTPFEDQEQFVAHGDDEELIDVGSVRFDENGNMSFIPDSVADAEIGSDVRDEVEKPYETENEVMRKSLEASRREIEERKQTPRPGVTTLEFDIDSEALLEYPEGRFVFWKIYM